MTGSIGSDQRYDLVVEGMTCEHCVAAVSSEIEALDGVVQVRVELGDAARASVVTVISSRVLDPDELERAVAEAGYATGP